jgi:hypothetical protein
MYPCKVNCLYKPGDADYELQMDLWLQTNFNYAQFTESVQTTENYDKPFSFGFGDYYRLLVRRNTTGKIRVFLKQIVMKTKDGFILKTVREDTGLVTSEGIYNKKSRISED